MGVELISLNAAELEARLPGMAAEFAHDVARTFGVEPEPAPAQSTEQLNAGLPDGVTTQGQLFFKAMDGGSRARVGAVAQGSAAGGLTCTVVRKIYVIGIGAGDPDHLTLQAAKAIGRTDVFFLLDKGEAKESMIELRRRLMKAYGRPSRRVAEGRDPERDRTPADYQGTVADWRSRRSAVTEALISEHLLDGETGSFLVWGDPSLYDSTIAILEEILARGQTLFEYEVIPGISSVSALAAKHRIGLNRVGQPFQVTTGRRLAEGWPEGVDDVVVMLDAQQAFAAYPDAHVYWGAYVGTEDEILRSGRVSEVADDIAKTRAEARERHGWIMDTYLLRRDS